MANNRNLHKANKAKNDEFYTQLSDIENELKHYTSHFKGKTVLCNCDDPRVSNFFRYFALNFHVLGLKRLISTCYMNDNPDLFSQGVETNKSIYSDFDGSFQCNELTDFSRIPYKQLHGDGTYSAGDFRSAECIELLKQADIVVTNPPFSLFREYVAQLVEFDKKFLIIGNMNAITYKEIFPLIKVNKMWLGYGFKGGNAFFGISDNARTNYVNGVYDETTRLVKFRNCCWYTNLDHHKRHEELILYKKYTPEEYPQYDNYRAIEVGKTADIPCDYNGVMGVPITFLDKYNPEQFEILGATESEGKGFSNGLYDSQSSVKQPVIGGGAAALQATVHQTYGSRGTGIITERGLTGARSTLECLSDLRIPGHDKYDRPYLNGQRLYFRLLIRRT